MTPSFFKPIDLFETIILIFAGVAFVLYGAGVFKLWVPREMSNSVQRMVKVPYIIFGVLIIVGTLLVYLGVF